MSAFDLKIVAPRLENQQQHTVFDRGREGVCSPLRERSASPVCSHCTLSIELSPEDVTIPGYLRGRGAPELRELTWVVGDQRVSYVSLTQAQQERLGMDDEAIESGWLQFRLGKHLHSPLIHLSPHGEVFWEYLGYYLREMDATMPLYTLEQLDAILTAYLGRQEVAA